jgi:hypothetical protein
VKRPSPTWATLRRKKPRKRAVLSPMDKVEIRAALNAYRYCSPKALAKRHKCSVAAIYRLERVT